MNPSGLENPEPQSPETQDNAAPQSTAAGAFVPANVEPVAQAEPAAPAPKIVGYCRECGKALHEANVYSALGAIYCEEHRPPQAASPELPPQPLPFSNAASPYTAPPYHAAQPPPLPSPLSVSGSPGLAFVLGLIPGVGAVYNGQYAKGLVHVVILGLAISLIGSGAVSGFEPLFGLLISCFWFYMAFEAYHTAKMRRAGARVDEFSSVFPRPASRHPAARVPVGPILLIALGTLFLLGNLDVLDMRKLLRYWPVLLIGMGIYMIYVRLTAAGEGNQDGQ